MSDKELKVKKLKAKSDIAVGSSTGETATKPSATGTKGKIKPNTKTTSSKKALSGKATEKKTVSNISTSKSKIAKNKSDNSLTASKSEVSVENSSSSKTLKITLCRSLIGCRKSHRACAKGLGLRRRESTVEVLDTPENRGMINQINYLLKVES